MAKVVRRCYNSTSECRDNRRKTFEPEGRSENNEKEKKVKVYYIDEDIREPVFWFRESRKRYCLTQGWPTMVKPLHNV